jgi:16S rRNA (adenine1518-N6/adenine1519-N6)-dimethyltransferase
VEVLVVGGPGLLRLRVQTLAQIKAILAERGFKPKHALGQNFLHDHNLINKLVDACEVKAGETILEVGPGTGALTEALLARGAHVVACELDDGFASMLPDLMASKGYGERFRLVHGDCLEKGRRLNREVVMALGDAHYKLVANLPYGAATPLMLSLLLHEPRCSLMGVTIQLEVAQRMMAPSGSKDYGLLSVVMQAGAEVEMVAKLPPSCFWPKPEITSAMALAKRRSEPATRNLAGLAEFCQKLFAKRRKQIGSILGREVAWPAGVRADMRPEQISVESLIATLDCLSDEDLQALV